MKKRTFYYSDEVNDDFANTHIKKRRIDEKFRYYNDSLTGKFKKFLLYRVLVTPIAAFYCKFVSRISYKNRRVMKGYKNKACFIYGNHTGYIHDAFDPTMVSFPRAADVVVNSDATSINGLKGLLLNIGAMPIPEDFHMMYKFADAMTHSVDKKHWIAIYPEAHIWPMYTKIRPFSSVSFRYPVKYGAPVFTYTMTFKKRRFSDRVKRTVYIDGPFLPDASLPPKAAAQKLRDEAYAAMCRSAEYSTYSYHEYVYVPAEPEQLEENTELA